MNKCLLKSKELNGFLFGIFSVTFPSRRFPPQAHFFYMDEHNDRSEVEIIKNLYVKNGVIYDSVETKDTSYREIRTYFEKALIHNQKVIKEELVDDLRRHLLFRISDFVTEICDDEFSLKNAKITRYDVVEGKPNLRTTYFGIRNSSRLLLLQF